MYHLEKSFRTTAGQILFLVISMAILVGFADVAMADQNADPAECDSLIATKAEVSGYSSSRLNYCSILELPIRSLDEIIALQNGTSDVPQTGSLLSEWHVRGGRDYGHVQFLNGVAFNNPITGRLTATLSPRMIGQFSYYPGGSLERFNTAESGFFDVLSRAGGSKYSGSVEIISDNVGGTGFDQNWYSANLRGPFPGLDKGSFFVFIERRWMGDRNPSAVASDVLPDSPDRLPGNWQDGWSYHGRADYPFTDKLSVTATADYIEDEWSEYQHVFLFDIDHTPRHSDKNLGLSARMDHAPTQNMSYSLAASHFSSESTTGDGTAFDDLEAYQRYSINPTYDNWDLFRTDNYEVLASLVDPGVAPGSPGDTILHMESYYNYFQHHQSSFFDLTGEISRRIGERHTLRGGIDFKYYTLRYYENYNPTSIGTYSIADVNRYGFTIDGEESDDLDYRNETKHPTDLSVGIEDRFEINGMVINAGLRYVRYDYDALQFVDPANPLDPGNATGVDTLDPGDLEAAPAFDYLLPRFGIGAGIGDNLVLRFNFGKYIQRAPYQYLYTGYDYIAAGIIFGRNEVVPAVALEPEKTTQYEIGANWTASENITLDAAAFYHDMDNQISTAYVSNASPFAYSMYGNNTVNPSTAKGIELHLTTKRIRHLRLDLKYTLSWAEGFQSYPDPAMGYNIIWQNPSGSRSTDNPLDYDRTHDLTGTIVVKSGESEGPRVGKIFPFENTTLCGVIKAGSGRPYTLMEVFDEAAESITNLVPRTGINDDDRPWTVSIDLKLEREFAIGEFHVTPFIWVKNLFDRENIADVWRSSGEPNTTQWLSTDEGEEFIGDYPEALPFYELKENDPTHYAPPRQFYFGLRASF